jgi:hypothetical protein
MAPVLLMIAQAAAASPAADRPAAAPPPPIAFDLAKVPRGELAMGLSRCPEGEEEGDIVVCARISAEGYDYEGMERRYRQGPMDAETGLFGTVRGRVYVESVGTPNGDVSKRVMVGIKLPF